MKKEHVSYTRHFFTTYARLSGRIAIPVRCWLNHPHYPAGLPRPRMATRGRPLGRQHGLFVQLEDLRETRSITPWSWGYDKSQEKGGCVFGGHRRDIGGSQWASVGCESKKRNISPFRPPAPIGFDPYWQRLNNSGGGGGGNEVSGSKCGKCWRCWRCCRERVR